MKFIPIIGVGLAIWGIVTGNWFKISLGVVLFLGGFLLDLIKKKGAMKDKKVFAVYEIVSKLIRIIRNAVESSNTELNNPKAQLAQGLFFLGVIDAASQAARLNDTQFIDLFTATFTDLEEVYTHDYRTRLLSFHQKGDTNQSGFKAIMRGGELYIKFLKGDTLAPLSGDVLINELILDKSFPVSVDAL